jgi:hypothetical protein
VKLPSKVVLLSYARATVLVATVLLLLNFIAFIITGTVWVSAWIILIIAVLYPIVMTAIT